MSTGVYPDLEFGEAPPGRPYVFINMVSTIDGKTVSGERDESVHDIGSDLDHATMRQIEEASDAVMVGAGSLRATEKIWFPQGLTRIVVTSSGDLPVRERFFSEGPAIVATTETSDVQRTQGAEVVRCGESEIDFHRLLKRLRTEYGIERLLVEGGSELNASLLEQDLADELFLTIAPKIKLGREVPTYAGGDPLPRESVMDFQIVSCNQVEDEIFVRYRRHR